MSNHSEAFVAFDSSKLRNAVAIANSCRRKFRLAGKLPESLFHSSGDRRCVQSGWLCFIFIINSLGPVAGPRRGGQARNRDDKLVLKSPRR